MDVTCALVRLQETVMMHFICLTNLAFCPQLFSPISFCAELLFQAISPNFQCVRSFLQTVSMFLDTFSTIPSNSTTLTPPSRRRITLTWLTWLLFPPALCSLSVITGHSWGVGWCRVIFHQSSLAAIMITWFQQRSHQLRQKGPRPISCPQGLTMTFWRCWTVPHKQLYPCSRFKVRHQSWLVSQPENSGSCLCIFHLRESDGKITP